MPILPSWLVPIGLAAAAIAVLCGLALVAWGLWAIEVRVAAAARAAGTTSRRRRG